MLGFEEEDIKRLKSNDPAMMMMWICGVRSQDKVNTESLVTGETIAAEPRRQNLNQQFALVWPCAAESQLD